MGNQCAREETKEKQTEKQAVVS